MKSNSTAAILLVVVLALGMSLGASGCKRDKSPAKLGLTESGASETTASTDGTASTDASGTGGKSQTAEQTGAGQPGGSGGSGATGGSGTSGGTSAGATGKTMKIKVLWWNDTGSRAPSNAEVVFGTSVFKPKPGKSDIGVLSGVPVGKTVEVLVYPDGRDGKKMPAKIVVAADMKPNSEQDAIHVEVKDGGVRVLGNPVIDFIQSFTR